jgi:hypothetical protein
MTILAARCVMLLAQFHFHDLVFGVYQLALHHSTVNAIDAVQGCKVVDPQLIAFLLKVTGPWETGRCWGTRG